MPMVDDAIMRTLFGPLTGEARKIYDPKGDAPLTEVSDKVGAR